MPDPIRVEEKYLELHEGLFQRIILVAVLKSVRFYVLVRDRLCPKEEDRKDRRPDFEAHHHNVIYGLVATWWEQWIKEMGPSYPDHGIPMLTLWALLAHEIQDGKIPEADARAWFSVTCEDCGLFDYTPEVLERMARHPRLTEWLSRRAAINLIQFMASQPFRIPTLEVLGERVLKDRSKLDPGTNRLRSMESVANDFIVVSRPIPTDLPELNRSLGGGFRLGETSIIAGVNAAGKTTLAMQMALVFAQHGFNVVIFTTERKPTELLFRLLSNYLNVEFSRFTNRSDIPDMNYFQTYEVTTIPLDIQRDYASKLLDFQTIWNRFYFVDWSEGSLTIYQNFEQEMDKIRRTGWDPNIVIFDWIGGGLEGVRGTRMEIRHTYNEGINILIKHGKRHNRHMLVTAQIAKTMAYRATKMVTMNMLAECKSMTDNASTFIGISALTDPGAPNRDGSKGLMTLQREQFLNVDKSTLGIPMLVRVEQHFNFQKFCPAPDRLRGGQKSTMEQMASRR